MDSVVLAQVLLGVLLLLLAIYAMMQVPFSSSLTDDPRQDRSGRPEGTAGLEDEVRDYVRSRNAFLRGQGLPERNEDAEVRLLMREREAADPSGDRGLPDDREREVREYVRSRNTFLRKQGRPVPDEEAEIRRLLDAG